MRFVFISGMALYPWGGSEELWSQTALRLRENGNAVTASVPFWSTISSRVTALHKRGIKVHVHPSRHSPFLARGWDKMMRKVGQRSLPFRWLKREKPDLVVISQGGITDGLDWMQYCGESGLPYAVITQCNSESWWPDDEVSRIMARAYAAAEKVFCVSQKNLELLECQINQSLPNAEVVRNPFNVSPEQPPAWPAENNVWRVACVARLEPAAKGQDVLLQVLSQAQWRNRPLEVNFYGTGSSKENLERLVHYHKLHNVRFRGHVADVRQIWEQNSLLVLASRYEGLPLALTEAMWCARPAVVTDVGGCAELCEDGTTGFVAAAPTVELLAETLERAWNQRQNWRELGINARAKVEKLVSLDPVADFGNRLLASSRQISDLPKIVSAVAC